MGEIGPIAKSSNLPQLCIIILALNELENQMRAIGAGIARCAQSLSDHPINRFGMYELRKGTGTGRLRRDVRDKTTKWMFSKVTIVSLDILLLIYERILTPTQHR